MKQQPRWSDVPSEFGMISKIPSCLIEGNLLTITFKKKTNIEHDGLNMETLLYGNGSVQMTSHQILKYINTRINLELFCLHN